MSTNGNKMLLYQFSKRTNGVFDMVLNLKRLRAERIACGITQDEMTQMMGGKQELHMLKEKRDCRYWSE